MAASALGGSVSCPPSAPVFSDFELKCYRYCDQLGNHIHTYNYLDRCIGDCSTLNGEPTSDWRHTPGLCWKKMYDRGVGTLPNSCSDPAREFFQGLCYTKCPPGLAPTTWSPMTCSQPCPPNTIEGGFANCTKQNSYGRGAGDQGNGCDPGYTNVGLYCYQFPLNFKNFNCRNDCYYSPVNRSEGYYLNCQLGGNYIDPTVTIPCKTPGTTIDPNGNGTQTIADTGNYNYNSRLRSVNDNNCQENWGSLCYPKCDIGFHGFGCCVCSADCGALRDDGATCHRNWENRGVGTVPDGCSDPNRVYQELLCYIPCLPDYDSFATTCTRSGCPDNSVPSTALACATASYDNSAGSTVPIPNVSDDINSSWNMAQMGRNMTTIFLNSVIILGCLFAILFIIFLNRTLRSKPIQ